MPALIPFELSESRKELLGTPGHILTLGGPGSGKTTIALLKAKAIIEMGLKKGQQILFLSFARATIARVDQQAKVIINPILRKQLEISTYHGFAWTLLKSHGYLLNGIPLRLLPPPEASSLLADIAEASRNTEKNRLFTEQGLLHFDLFAGLSAELLSRSSSLSKIISNAYPFIILDEFQDTNSDEWNFIQQLGKRSTLITLADLDQRIYEFRGADPARISEFIKLFNPIQFDFGIENNRSNGTDIAQFGNDLLTGTNKGKTYQNVKIKPYTIRQGNAIHFDLKTEVLDSYKRLKNLGDSNWSLAILVPTKKLMLNLSDYLASKQIFPGNRFLPELYHDVALEMAGPSLSAVVIARLLERKGAELEVQHILLWDLHEHIRGRNGNNGPGKTQLGLANFIKDFISTGKVRSGTKKAMLVNEVLRISQECKLLKFTGDPGADWIMVRKLLAESSSESIKQVAADAQYLRLLRKGAVLNSGLASIWRSNGNYLGASNLVRNALLQEHFSSSTAVWKGIHLMTIHKAKGKEFDEVIIYEGMYQGRIVHGQPGSKEFEQSRLALRVAITRAMKRTTILTPIRDICSLL